VQSLLKEEKARREKEKVRYEEEEKQMRHAP
jgi:hypothetical protein